MASLKSISSNTSAGIIFRTIFVFAAWIESLRALNWGLYLFAPSLWPIYDRSRMLVDLVGTVAWFIVVWAVILLPEKRPWADVGWTRGHVASSLLLGGLIGSGVYLFYVGIIAVCGWYWIVGHYAWSNIPMVFLESLLIALEQALLFQGYFQSHLEQRQGSGRALFVSSLLYGTLNFAGIYLLAASERNHSLLLSPHALQTVILSSAMGLFFGGTYLWNGRLWTAVGVRWGCACMDYLLTYTGSDASGISVFRYTVAHHAFDLIGIGFATKVTILATAGIVMALLAKRRGHWQERGIPGNED